MKPKIYGIDKLERKIKKLEKQIEKMKCCENCQTFKTEIIVCGLYANECQEHSKWRLKKINDV